MRKNEKYMVKPLNEKEQENVNGGCCPYCGMTVYDETNGTPPHGHCPGTPGIFEQIFIKKTISPVSKEDHKMTGQHNTFSKS